jgi:translation initiation factor IF-1
VKKKFSQNSNQQGGAKKRRKSLYKKKSDKIYLEGVVVDTLPGVKFVVKIERSNGLEPLKLTCQTLSMLKVKRVKIIKGDSVEVEIDPSDLTKGLIVSRF